MRVGALQNQCALSGIGCQEEGTFPEALLCHSQSSHIANSGRVSPTTSHRCSFLARQRSDKSFWDALIPEGGQVNGRNRKLDGVEREAQMVCAYLWKYHR